MIEMTREELIRKWMDDELSPEEYQAFMALEDSEELIRLSRGIQAFKAPEFNLEQARESVFSQIAQRKTKGSGSILKYALRIAAVVVIALGSYYFLMTQETEVHTEMAQKSSLSLPDASEVVLNAASTLTYNSRKWSSAREVDLNGEAYFKVAKGKSFTVWTSDGSVTVLGTEFNVKSRNGMFEVVCYEGSVAVESGDNSKILKAGDRFLIIDGKYIATEKEARTQPSWTLNESYFRSMPFEQVVMEFERQYNVVIQTKNINLEARFTGSFIHDDIDLALKSITLPMNLKYSLLNGNTILLSGE